MHLLRVAWIFCIILCSTTVVWLYLGIKPWSSVFKLEKKSYNSPEDFKNFDNETGTSDGCYIVPNYVHFIRFKQPSFSFADIVCVLAAFKHQKPDKIFFHTDVPNFSGKYWNYLLSQKGFKEVLQINYFPRPDQIFGQPLGFKNFHGGDIARLQVLIKYGGIFLDNDSYIVRSLDDFRRYEMTLGWAPKGNISNQVIIAHKNARFLREWLNSYKGSYHPNSWFYNAGIRPTREILLKRPELIHRVTQLLAEYWGIVNLLYLRRDQKWKDHYAIHLLIRHQYMYKTAFAKETTYPFVFNETNIKRFSITFRDMVEKVFPIS